MLPLTQQEVARDRDAYDSDTARWVLEDLTPILFAEGLRMSPWFKGHTFAADPTSDEMLTPRFYSCRNLDLDTGRCGIYDRRPDPCQGFPWHGNEPNPAAVIPPKCSYRADLSQRVILGPKPSRSAPA